MKNFLLDAVSSVLQFGKKGGKVNWSGSNFSVTDSSGTLVPLSASSPTASDHVATKGYVQTAVVSGTAVSKITSTQTTTSTTQVNITELYSALDANSTYRIEAYIKFRSSVTTAGLSLSYTQPSSSTSVINVFIPVAINPGYSVVENFIIDGAQSVTGQSVADANTDYVCYVKGIVNSGSAGNLQLTFSASSAATITLQTGSILLVTKVS